MWVEKILCGKKHCEVRTWKLSQKYINEDVALVETPSQGGWNTVRAVVTFLQSEKYTSLEACLADKKNTTGIDSMDSVPCLIDKPNIWCWRFDNIRRVSPQKVKVPRGTVTFCKVQLYMN